MSLHYEGVIIDDTLTVGPNGHIVTTVKGQLLADNGTQSTALSVGTNGQILTADSTTAIGLKWNGVAGANTGTSPDSRVAVGVYSSTAYTTASGTSLNFKNLLPGTSGAITITNDTANGTVDIDVSPSNISLSSLGVPTTSVNLNGQNIINLATPVNATDAANKSYVDAVAQGLDVKASCYAASTSDLAAMGITVTSETTTTITGTVVAGAFTIDGLSITSANNNTFRLLLKNISAAPLSAAYNGIYTSNISGNNITLTRTTDFNSTSNIIPGAFTFIELGTVNAETGWILITQNPITVGTTSLVFAQFSSAGTLTAGNGITISGNQISVNASGSTLINASAASLKFNSGTSTTGYPLLSAATAGTEPSYAQLSLTSAVTGTLPVANGGTGSTATSFTNNTIVQVNSSGNLVSTTINPANIPTIQSGTANTNGTTTSATILTLATVSNTTYMWKFNAVGRRTDAGAPAGGQSGGWAITSIYKNAAGTVTKIGETRVYGSDDTTWNVTTSISGTSVLLTVLQSTTVSTETVTWNATVSTVSV